ncbi:MAG: helix-turn-helix domain-containing protein, partial [Bdellovibrio sp.]
RMGIKILEKSIILEDIIEQSCPHFRRRYCQWISTDKHLINTNQSEKFPSNLTDLEFKFLKSLRQGPMTKNLIIEILWPDFSNHEIANGRFHQLIHRLNKKLGGLIKFKNGTYQFQN